MHAGLNMGMVNHLSEQIYSTKFHYYLWGVTLCSVIIWFGITHLFGLSRRIIEIVVVTVEIVHLLTKSALEKTCIGVDCVITWIYTSVTPRGIKVQISYLYIIWCMTWHTPPFLYRHVKIVYVWCGSFPWNMLLKSCIWYLIWMDVIKIIVFTFSILVISYKYVLTAPQFRI